MVEEVKFWSADGKLVHTKKIKGTEKISIESWPKGLNIFKAMMENGEMKNGKLMVQQANWEYKRDAALL